jgi:hypothetical protein
MDRKLELILSILLLEAKKVSCGQPGSTIFGPYFAHFMLGLLAFFVLIFCACQINEDCCQDEEDRTVTTCEFFRSLNG